MFLHTNKEITFKSHVQKWATVFAVVFTGVVVVPVVGFVVYGKYIVQYEARNIGDVVATIPQFPVGVDPVNGLIAEDSVADDFFEEHYATRRENSGLSGAWFDKALGKLALMDWYQNLASASSRILVIQPGERKEQIAHNFGKILKWTEAEREQFQALVVETEPVIQEGKFYPGKFTVAKSASPVDVAPLVVEGFNDAILEHYGPGVDAQVPLEQAIIIASLLEREAYDFTDARHISGVIWNRLFTDMRLQLDATLQYARGDKPWEPWWPTPRPQDKYIDSPYNTYKYEGLPPTAISNPSAEAVLAALNPVKTSCMFYFHDDNAGFHCSDTYEEHVEKLKSVYGRGR